MNKPGFQKYDCVALREHLRPDLPKGTRGAVVLVHESAEQQYEVEFIDQHSATVDVVTVSGRQLALDEPSSSLLESLVRKIKRVSGRDDQMIPGGGQQIGRLLPRPDGLFLNAYSHEIYGPLSEDNIDRLGQLVGKEIPPALRRFYLQANGLSLFSNSLSIAGLRREYSRRPGVSLPVSLEYGNTLEVPAASEGELANAANWLKIGFYSYGASNVYIGAQDTCPVFAAPRFKTAPILYRWPSLDAFLESEVDRLCALYQARQGRVDPLNPLPPPWIEE